MHLVGWMSAALLATCAMPQVVKTARTGRADDLSWAFLLLWFFGELLGLTYVSSSGDLPLVANYGTNALLVGVIVTIKARRRDV